MLKRLSIAASICSLTLTTGPAVAAPPNNDHYADALVIESLPFTASLDMSDATSEPLETTPSCYPLFAPTALSVTPVVGADPGSVWYRVRATEDTTITVDASASDFRVAIGVYEGEDATSHREMACTSSGVVVVDLAAGGSYAIQLMRFAGWEGTDLSVTVLPGRQTVAPPDPQLRADVSSDEATGDATVVAVIDTEISPYHWDFLASRMPQVLDANAANDLPLSEPPHTWLPGFPDPDAAFASYDGVELTLEEADPGATYDDLSAADVAAWDGVRPSETGAINYHWFPGTKLIGALTFSPDGRIEPADHIRHGTPVSSAAVGNYVGSCPECLLVFIQTGPAESMDEQNRQTVAAFEWAFDQPWIDVVSSSSAIYTPVPTREPDFFDNALDPVLQRAAVERGQSVFQASGNGIDTLVPFVVPNPTVTNSHMGPDWLITVGGITPSGDHVLGAGKPVDIAAPAISVLVTDPNVPVGQHRRWSGTSFSTPTIAGTYAHALYRARRSLPGISRSQDGGVVATTDGSFQCGSERPACELADGRLTADELRTRLFQGAVPTTNRNTRIPFFPPPDGFEDPDPAAREWRLMNQGHGSYLGRTQRHADWLAEGDRIVDPLLGLASVLDRPDGESAWMIVDSYCRQEIWGSWEGGYYVAGGTDLPGPDAEWPTRSAIEATCPYLPLPVPSP